jgi:hypothetical protein
LHTVSLVEYSFSLLPSEAFQPIDLVVVDPNQVRRLLRADNHKRCLPSRRLEM